MEEKRSFFKLLMGKTGRRSSTQLYLVPNGAFDAGIKGMEVTADGSAACRLHPESQTALIRPTKG